MPQHCSRSALRLGVPFLHVSRHVNVSSTRVKDLSRLVLVLQLLHAHHDFLGQHDHVVRIGGAAHQAGSFPAHLVEGAVERIGEARTERTGLFPIWASG